MKQMEGRFLVTEDVLDAQYLLTESDLDLVLVRPTGHELDLETIAANPQDAFYEFDPDVKKLDEATRGFVNSNLPGLTLRDEGFAYDRINSPVAGSSLEHLDSGREWPFIGPLACSWVPVGRSEFRAERLPQAIIKPDRDGVYSLGSSEVWTRLFVATVRSANHRARTKVTQEPFDRVFFANQPWATLHGVTRTSEKRRAYTYDHRLDVPEHLRSRWFDLRTRHMRQKIENQE